MFVLGKALSAKKKVVYNKERATEGYDDLKKAATEAVKTLPAPSSSPAPTPNSDPAIVELTKQLVSLTLMIQANMNLPKTETTNAPRTSDRRCVWCDSTSHSRRGECLELKDAMGKGLVSINANNRIVNAKNGEEIPTMFGKGGMKRILDLANPTPAIAVTNVTLEPTYGSIGSEGTVHVNDSQF